MASNHVTLGPQWLVVHKSELVMRARFMDVAVLMRHAHAAARKSAFGALLTARCPTPLNIISQVVYICILSNCCSTDGCYNACIKTAVVRMYM